MNTHKQTERRTAYILILIFVFLTAGIVTTSSLYYLDYEKRYRAGVESQLSAIADLKVGELTQFRKERLSDATMLFRNVSFSALIRHYWENPRDADVQRQIQAWIGNYKATYRYDRVFLLDARGVVRMSAPTGPEPKQPQAMSRKFCGQDWLRFRISTGTNTTSASTWRSWSPFSTNRPTAGFWASWSCALTPQPTSTPSSAAGPSPAGRRKPC